jgi:hypothetical protein
LESASSVSRCTSMRPRSNFDRMGWPRLDATRNMELLVGSTSPRKSGIPWRRPQTARCSNSKVPMPRP